MAMKKTVNRNAHKLSIHRETLRCMSDLEIRAVQGGFIFSYDGDACTTYGTSCYTVSCIAC
jgi:hypothetical protein